MKKKNYILILNLFLSISFFLTTGCPGPDDPPPPLGGIVGTVQDNGTNEAIQGVTIVLTPGGTTKTTGDDGRFEFKNLEPGQYTMQAQKPGYVTNEKIVTVNIGEVTDANIPLTLESIDPPAVTSGNATNITQTTAQIEGNITSLGSTNITSYGHCWDTKADPTSANSSTNKGSTTQTSPYTSNLSGLTAGTKYYIRAYATSSAGTSYSNEVSFTTTPEGAVPSVTTADITNIIDVSATGGGEVTDTGTEDITARGVCWNIDNNPTIANSKTTDGTGTGTFVSSITALTESTTYFVRAYATNSIGTAYGEQKTFTTKINNAPIASFTNTTGYPGEDVSFDASASTDDYTGNSALEVRWQFDTGESFTAWTTTKTATHSYTTSGSKEVTLEVRDAQQQVGTITKTVTVAAAGPASLMTYSPENSTITHNSAKLLGEISDLGTGSSPVSAHGFCWSTTSGAADISGNHVDLGSSSTTKTYSAVVTGLTSETTYYVRAYATNSASTSYGNEITFTTKMPSAPTAVSTNYPTDVTQTTATANGTLNNIGVGVTITQHGFCWSTSANPTTSGSHSSKGSISATGSFTSALTALTANTTYHIRAYITTSAGTTYGEDLVFVTLQ